MWPEGSPKPSQKEKKEKKTLKLVISYRWIDPTKSKLFYIYSSCQFPIKSIFGKWEFLSLNLVAPSFLRCTLNGCERIRDRWPSCVGATPFCCDGRVVADAIILDHAPIASTLKKRRPSAMAILERAK